MYIKEENGKVIIYEVILDSEELEKIRKKLIYKYSKVTQHCSKKDTRPIQGEEYYDTYMIEAVKSEYVGKYDTCDFYGTIHDVYNNTYKKYKYPDIVIYINEFLNGKFANLPKLKDVIKVCEENKSNQMIEMIMYIKKIIDSIHIKVIKKYEINSINDLIVLLSSLDDERLNKISSKLSSRLKSDKKTLSYLVEEK